MWANADDKRSAITKMAKASENAERYEDMCTFMKELVNLGDQLDVAERNLLSVAYKNVIGARRASWRALTSESEGNPNTLDTYKTQIEAELKKICQEVISLLKDKLIPNEMEPDAKVFYQKMAADYYRYLAEALKGDKEGDTTYEDHAHQLYTSAYDLAQTKLLATNPIRLGLALNHSVCLYEIKKDQTEACKLAKQAFDDAITKLDELNEGDYKDSTLIMQLLRDNLTLWTSQDAAGDDEDAN